MKRLPALLAGLLIGSLAVAQDDQDGLEPAEPQRRYTVEIIVFSYAEDVSVGTELFLPDEPPPVEDLLEDDIPVFGDDVIVTEEPAEDEPPPTWIVVPALDPAGEPAVLRNLDGEEPNPFQLVLLTEDEFTLTDAMERLERLDAYETLMHFGWTQPAFPEEETPAIELPLLAEPPPELRGTLTLYLSRYLHLVVDLEMDAPEAFDTEVIDDESFLSFGDSRPRYEVDDSSTPVVRFRIQEDRILKNGELRYFDHPKFGLLAKVMRVEEPEPDEGAPLAARP